MQLVLLDMKYSSFLFHNFKGIGDLELDLSGPVTTLIGLNESGKTTILEAIFCFSYGAENLDVLNPSMASLREPERWIPIAHRANFNDKIEISAVVSLDGDDKRDLRTEMLNSYNLHLDEVQDTVTITETYYFENSRHVPEKNRKLWSLSLIGTKGRQTRPRQYPGDSPEWRGAVSYLAKSLPSIWYFPNFLFELPERFMLGDGPADEPTEERDKSRFYCLTFDKILESLGSGANLQTHVADRRKSGDRVDLRNLRSLLLEMGREITKTVFEGWNRIVSRPITSQEVELDADVDEQSGRTFLELKIKGSDGYYDLSERSLGFRWFFMFLLMTTYRHGVDSAERGVMFLLDEPASNLHSTAQAELLKSFENLAQSCHLVYTTHSHHMINISWLDSAYVVKNEALGDESFEHLISTRMATATKISATRYRRFVSENPKSTSYFQPVLDLLEYRPSDLEPVPNVVLVEGKSDFYLLRYCIDVLGLTPTLKLIPGGGAGSLDPLIRLHIGWGKSFVVLLDGDDEGRQQRKRYEQIFDVLLRGRLLLLPEICRDSNILEVEHLLSESSRKAFINKVFAPEVPKPTEKKALATAVVELLAGREVVNLDEQSKMRIERLLSGLQDALTAQEA